MDTTYEKINGEIEITKTEKTKKDLTQLQDDLKDLEFRKQECLISVAILDEQIVEVNNQIDLLNS